MFRIIEPSGFLTTPWKNGGGITHEIAQEPGPKDWLWRISIAEVASDGPFSRFEGLSRVLTVIEGDGIDLHHADGLLQARPLHPVAFSGDTPIDGRLTCGPIRDLNVIFDPARIAARVSAVEGPVLLDAGDDLLGFLCLSGQALAGGEPVPAQAFALGRQGKIRVPPGAAGLVLRLIGISPAAA